MAQLDAHLDSGCLTHPTALEEGEEQGTAMDEAKRRNWSSESDQVTHFEVGGLPFRIQ